MTSPSVQFFASTLLSKLGVKCPRHRVISKKDSPQEYKEMIMGLDWASRSHPEVKRLVRLCLNRPFILLQEYVPGLNQNTFTQSLARKYFKNEAEG